MGSSYQHPEKSLDNSKINGIYARILPENIIITRFQIFNMKRSIVFECLIILFVLLSILLMPGVLAQALVKVAPGNQTVYLPDYAEVRIDIENATGLYGFQFDVQIVTHGFPLLSAREKR